MANPTDAFGLRPTRYKNGTPWNGAANPYYANATPAVAMFLGDPVVVVGDSNDSEVEAVGAGSFASGMLSEIEVATLADGNKVTGVVVAIYPVTNASLPYKLASTEAIIMVADDPNIIFQVRDNGNTLLTNDTVGLNGILIATAGGSTSTGRSGMELDTSATAPTADGSNMLAIRNLSRIPDNELLKNAVWDVTLMNHTELCGSTQDGVS